MLYLIGLGIWDEGDISLNGVKAAKRAAKVYSETYTSAWGGNLKKLEKEIGKPIKVIGRADMEEKSARIIKEAKKADVAILVPGDPLSATTHSSMVAEARDAKVEVRIIHSSSIFTAVATTGLSLYSFGKTVTVVTPSKKYKPDSYYRTIQENLANGMHTLILLDIEMSVQDGLTVLMDLERKKQGKVFTPRSRLLVTSAIGSEKSKVNYGKITELAEEDFPPPAVIVVPGKLSFFEKEMLDRL